MAERTPQIKTERALRRRNERILALFSLALIAVAWFLGSIRAEAILLPFVEQAMPDAGHFTLEVDGVYAAWFDDTENDLLGYVAVGEADGYGGPLFMVVAVSPEGEVTNALIADHRETPAWMDRIRNSNFIDSLSEKMYNDPFTIREDLDGVTGATRSAEAIAEAVARGSNSAAQVIGLPTEEFASPEIQIGIPEITLVLLFGIGFVAHQRKFKYTKQARWISLIAGLVILGFIYNKPLTLAYINRLLLGFWPAWQTELYFYLLIGGIIFVFTVDNKNPYCEWFCPFGAAQECLGLVGGAKPRQVRNMKKYLKWLPRILALSAILLAVYFRSPTLTSYELFGTLFAFVGSTIQFIALALVVIASLFIIRPWCRYLCPLDPVVDFIRIYREWIKELWLKIRTRKTA